MPTVKPLSLALNTNTGLFYDTTNAAIGLSVAGVEAGYLKSGLLRLSLAGGASNQLSIQAESTANNQVETYNATSATASAYTMRRGHGTIAAPAVAAGVAAVLAIRHRTPIQDVGIHDLQQELREHGAILHLREEFPPAAVQ